MKKILFLHIISLMVTCFGVLHMNGQNQFDKWRLVWSDEFEVNGLLDCIKWGYDVGGHEWGNYELQYYIAKTSKNDELKMEVILFGFININQNNQA
jgi:hypothetical protein